MRGSSVGKDPATREVGGLEYKSNVQDLNLSSTFSETQFSTVGFQSSALQLVSLTSAAENVTDANISGSAKADFRGIYGSPLTISLNTVKCIRESTEIG